MKPNACIRYKSIVFPVGRGHTGVYGKHVLRKQPRFQFLIYSIGAGILRILIIYRAAQYLWFGTTLQLRKNTHP